MDREELVCVIEVCIECGHSFAAGDKICGLNRGGKPSGSRFPAAPNFCANCRRLRKGQLIEDMLPVRWKQREDNLGIQVTVNDIMFRFWAADVVQIDFAL